MIQEQFYKIARIEYIKFLRLLIKNVKYQVKTENHLKYIRENNLHIQFRTQIFLNHTIN
jgi:hypothetical protein